MSRADFVGRLGELESLVMFFPEITREYRQDIQDALLFAQLRASQPYDFQSQWHSWIERYRQLLQDLGFQSRGLVTGDSEVIGAVEDLDRAMFRITNPQIRNRLGQLVQDTFLRLGVRDRVVAFFQDESPSAVQSGSFQLMPCTLDAGQQVMTLLCSLRLNVDDHSAGSRRLILYFKGGAYGFEPQRFESRRAEVRAYLAGRSNAFITRVEL